MFTLHITQSTLHKYSHNRRGVTLIEILISMVLIALASIATLSYFSHAKGAIGKTGNRRAALERARQRLEQLLVANTTSITPPANGAPYWFTCTGPTPCAWSAPSATRITQNVSVDDLPTQPMESSVRWVDDLSAGTGGPPGPIIYDALAFDVKVGFVPGWDPSNAATDNDFNRVHVRTLRTP